MGTFVHCDSNGGNVTTITGVTWGTAGAATQAGDLAILFWVFLNTETPTDPTSETWSLVTGPVSQDCEARLLYRICDGTESGDITGWSTTGAGNRQLGILFVVRGYSDISGFLTFLETVNGTTHDCPTLTTGNGFGALTLVFAADRAGSAATITPPSGWATRTASVFAATGTGGTVGGIADDSLTDASTMPVNPGTWDGFVSSDDALTITLSLRPAASGVTVTPAATATLVAAPQATPSVSDIGEPAITAATVAAPQAIPSVSDSGAPAVISAPVALPQATITANATVTPAAIAATASLPASARNVGSGPAVLAAVAALPQAAVQAAVNVTPATVATVAGVTAATAGVIVVIQPSSVTVVGAVPAAVASAAALVTPSATVVLVAIPQAIRQVHDSGTPNAIALTAALLQVSTIGHANIAQAVIAALVSLPAATIVLLVPPVAGTSQPAVMLVATASPATGATPTATPATSTAPTATGG